MNIIYVGFRSSECYRYRWTCLLLAVLMSCRHEKLEQAFAYRVNFYYV